MYANITTPVFGIYFPALCCPRDQLRASSASSDMMLRAGGAATSLALLLLLPLLCCCHMCHSLRKFSSGRQCLVKRNRGGIHQHQRDGWHSRRKVGLEWMEGRQLTSEREDFS